MDFANAVVLVGMVYGLVELYKRLVPTSPAWATALASVVAGIAATFLVSETVFAHAQVIGGRPLDEMNGASLLTVGLFAGFLAVGVHEALVKAVKNIGQNQDPPA